MSGSRTPPLLLCLREYRGHIYRAIVQDANTHRSISTIGGGTVIPVFQGEHLYRLTGGIYNPVFTNSGTLVEIELHELVIPSGPTEKVV